jgi:tetratricopeptide (TPR) repeat protein
MRLFILGILFVLVTAAHGFAQVQVPVKITTKNAMTDKKEAGIVVKIMDGSTVVGTYTSDNTGELKFNIPGGKKYRVEFSKPGKVSRFMIWDLKNVVDEVIQGTAAPKLETNMSLYDEVPNVDFSYFQSNPATEFFYDPVTAKDIIQPDLVLAKRTYERQEKLKKEILAAQGQSDAQYNALIKQADTYFGQNKYEEALNAYLQASTLKPTEKYPANQIVIIDGIIKSQKNANAANAQLEQDYQNLINAGNTLRDQKKYDEAIAKYTDALTKKQEQYPRDQITLCQNAQAEAKKAAETQVKYEAAMKAGDGFYTQKSWMAAKDKYKEAQRLRPNDAAASAKIADIDLKLNAQKAEQENMKKYSEATDAGDVLLGQQKYVEAKAKYNEALTIQPGATYAVDKVKECDLKLAEIEKEKAKIAQIEKLISEGNVAFIANQLPAAKLKFQEVLKLDATQPIAIAKLKEIDDKFAEEKENADKIAKAKQLVTEGDALAKTGKLAEANAKYSASLALKPDPAVQTKIDAINAQLTAAASKAEQKVKFEQALKEGDAAITANDLVLARSKYNEAATIDASSSIPKQKISDLDKRVAAENAALDKSTKYSAAMSAGEAALNAKDYTLAKQKFQEAISIDNSKQEAKDKLSAVQKIIDTNTALELSNAKFAAAMKAGDDLKSTGKLEEAKVKYLEAQKINPASTAPAEKIKEIDSSLEVQAKQKQITALLNEAAVAMTKKDYTTAKAKYQQVLAIDNANTAANSGIETVSKAQNDLIGEAERKSRFEALKNEGISLMGQNNFSEAKQKLIEAKTIQADPVVDQKIAECTAKIAESQKLADNETKYSDALQSGKTLAAARKYDEAIVKFNEALTYKNASEPKELITAANMLKANEAKLTKQMADFEAAVKQGDAALATKDYSNAIKAYDVALAMKQDPSVIAKRTEAENASKDSSVKAEQEQYQKILSAGQKSIDEKNYPKAIEMYNRALTFRANDPFPKQKLAEIELAQLIAEADKLFADKNWSQAKSAYEAVLVKDATNAYSKQQSLACDANMIAEKGDEIEKEYRKIVNKGDDNLTNKDYKKAIELYNRALTLRPADPYPKKKLAEIEELLKPKPTNPVQPVVVQTTQPVVTNTPQPLAALGTETDNSIIESQQRLEKAAKERKGRTSARFARKVNETQSAGDALTEKQLASTTEAASTFANIASQNAVKADSSDVFRQENVATIEEKTTAIQQATDASYVVKESQIYAQKDQLNLANQSVEDVNATLEGSALTNAEKIKQENQARASQSDVEFDESTKEKLNNDQQFMTMKVNGDSKIIDDFNEHKAVEQSVLNASNSVRQVNELNQNKQDQEVLDVENKIVSTTNAVNDKIGEEIKQSPLNNEELAQIEKTKQLQSDEAYQRQLQNSIDFKADINQKEQVIIDFEETTQKQRENNAVVIESGRSEKDELDRANFNTAYEKSLENKGTIGNEVILQEEYAELPSIVVAENTAAYQAMKNSDEERKIADEEREVLKHQGNQNTLNKQVQTVQQKTVENNATPGDNSEALKITQKGLGDTETQQLSQQKDKNLAARKLLEGIEKKEIVYSEKVANDLGQLYPEGVSQEQFDVLGEDGLVSSVVTRRVVVRAGHGDIYIRTQSLDGITYSKNGQATTEITWQRETQDAKLKRNY